tara:strand:- start:1185 stop:1475 length:291 start_codon:yes stop_codon:yes gene_type:complete
MYIVSLNYIKPLEEVNRYLPEHLEFLNKYYESGDFILSGRKEPRTGGVILAKTQGLKDLEQILNLDPFYREGVAEYDIVEMVPSKSSPELSSLVEV